MKRLTLILAVVCLTIVSCVPVSVNEPVQGDNTLIEYYVKYASNGGGRTLSYTDENGKTVTLENIGGDSFERTVGPVSAGFSASFYVMPKLSTTYVNARIEVKKGDNPFVVKAEYSSSVPGESATVSYTIKE